MRDARLSLLHVSCSGVLIVDYKRSLMTLIENDAMLCDAIIVLIVPERSVADDRSQTIQDTMHWGLDTNQG